MARWSFHTSSVCSADSRASSRCDPFAVSPDRAAPASLAQHGRRRLQQCVALLEDLVVVGAHPRPARLPLHEQVVEEPAALRRVALDQGEVLGGEEHGAHRAEHVAGPRHAATGRAGPGSLGPA